MVNIRIVVAHLRNIVFMVLLKSFGYSVSMATIDPAEKKKFGNFLTTFLIPLWHVLFIADVADIGEKKKGLCR